MNYFTPVHQFLTRLAIFVLMSTGVSMAYADAGFVIQDMSGKQQRLSDYKGKWVVVNYWATWCPPCLDEIPDLVLLNDQHKDKDLVVIGVVLDYKSAEEVSKFVDDMLMSYPIVLGNDKTIQQIGPADVLPTTYIYNPQGKLVKTKHGAISREFLEKLITVR